MPSEYANRVERDVLAGKMTVADAIDATVDRCAQVAQDEEDGLAPIATHFCRGGRVAAHNIRQTIIALKHQPDPTPEHADGE